MIKTKSIAAGLILLVLFLHAWAACNAAEEPPTLFNCRCQAWVTYEDDSARFMERWMREKGTPLSKAEYKFEKAKARAEKLSYIEGMMDAYSRTHEITKNRYFTLPYTPAVYEREIDDFCTKAINKNDHIKEVILVINKKLKESGR